MNERPLLTVAIPTYNRSETLRKILNDLVLEKNASFEVLVSDDQSQDDTEQVVKKFQETLPHLVYHKNNINLGYSGNVNKLYELANTEYVWFLCDDDTVLPGAIESIERALRKYRPVVAVFNHRWRDPYGRESQAVEETDVLHDDLERLSDYQPLMRMTFLSALVVRRDASLPKIPDSVQTDNVFFQLSLGLLLLSKKFSFLECGDVIIHRNVGYRYGDFFKFYLADTLKAIFAVNHVFENKKFVTWMKRGLPLAFIIYLSQKIGLFSYEQKPTQETWKKIRQFYGWQSFIIRLFPLMKLIIPTLVLKVAYVVQLITLHGYSTGLAVYRNSLNRATRDERKTGFTKYK